MDLVANEIESLRALRHPHIVDYLGTEKEDNTLRIFLEYALATTLRTVYAFNCVACGGVGSLNVD